MSEDRPLEDAAAAIGRLDAKIAEMEAREAARQARSPTGDVELAFRGTPKDGTLFLQGQMVSRTTYAALWAWAQASGSVVAGGYTVGDGSTTFGLPDMRDRVIVGAGGAYVLGATGGAATRAITVANMPGHDHDVTVGNHAQHDHNVTPTLTHSGHSHAVTGNGSHGGHNSGTASYWIPLNDGQGQFSVAANGNTSVGHNHGTSIEAPGNHSISESQAGPTTHSVTQSQAGSGTAFDVRQPYLAANLAVWT